MKRPILLLIVFMWSAQVCAQVLEDEKENTRYPLGCRDMGYSQELKALRLQPEPVGERQTLYFLFNSSPNPVSLYHMRDKESMYSVNLSHTMNPKQWAVLSSSEHQVNFLCTVPDKALKSPYGKIVDCGEYLKVCEYNHVIFGLNNRGNFWVVKNNTRNGAVGDVVRYGIIPAT